MEKRVYEAAIGAGGGTPTLSQLLVEDPYLLDRTFTNYGDRNALHIGALAGNEEFVIEILQKDSSFRSAYHMCFARDRDGRNPLHLAAINGRTRILDLVQSHDHLVQAALEKADRGRTILHLCVQHNQLEALKSLLKIFTDPEFVSAKDEDGMTILHLAIYCNQNQSRRDITIYLINNIAGIVNIMNANAKTALDLLLQQAKINLEIERSLTSVVTQYQLRSLLQKSNLHQDIVQSLVKAKALTGKAVFILEKDTWLQKRRDGIMVAASLIATMAFQAMVSPPGGVWQEDLFKGPNPHRAGESVMAQTHPKHYDQLIWANTIAFVSSLSTIILLVRGSTIPSRIFFFLLTMMMWLSVAAIAVCYGISLVTIAPDKSKRGYMSAVCEIAIIVAMVWSPVLVAWSSSCLMEILRRGLKARP